ncbi:MAG: restriction endonuclease [archaeon]
MHACTGMDGVAFEEYVAKLYKDAGYWFVQRTPQPKRTMLGKNLGQVDLVYFDPGRQSYIYCECKYRSQSKVTRKDVVYFLDVLQRRHHAPAHAEMITNTAYDAGAVDAARSTGLRLLRVQDIERETRPGLIDIIMSEVRRWIRKT